LFHVKDGIPNPAGGFFNAGFTDLGDGVIDFGHLFTALHSGARTTTSRSPTRSRIRPRRRARGMRTSVTCARSERRRAQAQRAHQPRPETAGDRDFRGQGR
jgi:sugar phosphate isomerase/epimerase